MIEILHQWDAPHDPSAINAAFQAERGDDPRRAWLHCYWEPGDTWMPVERWVVAQMTPRVHYERIAELCRAAGEDSFEAGLYRELEGPNPRAGAHYDPIKGRLVYREGVERPLITLRQWRLWRSHDAYATPVWVVQGDRGGHRRKFSRTEAERLRMRKLPHEAPVPGSLPYAPPDNRVVEQLRRASQLAHAQAAIRDDWRRRNAKAVLYDDAGRILTDGEAMEANAAEQAMLREYDEWLETQVDKALTEAKVNYASMTDA